MNRPIRLLLSLLTAAALLPAVLAARATDAAAAAVPATKVFRYAFLSAETSLDPVKIQDLYSRTLTPHIFEAPYHYDHLARPIKLKPLTADGMPQHSADFRTWTVKIRPGIYFAADPAFNGKKRELVAQDYVYALKRFADPANLSPAWTGIEAVKYVGLNQLRRNAVAGRKPFDYDHEIPGLRALDRYTIQYQLEDPRPRFIDNLTSSDLFGAVAREVIEHYGAEADAHPVGTGPFKLAEWRRSSFIALERNPDFRETYYDAEPAANDAEGQALLARFKGRRLPMVDRVEISVIEEDQPRWLSFVNAEADFIEKVSADFISTAMPGNKVAPNLAKRGIRGYRQLEPASTYVIFNMESPVVGGYSPAQVALRRAISLALDTPREIKVLRFDQGSPAETPFIPYTSGFDAAFKTEMGDYDPARAKALLDLYGYVDRDGDGWREMPDGSPLVLELASQADKRSRALDELTTKDMAAIGIRMVLKIAQWSENLKAARAGKLMMWALGGSAAGPDGADALGAYESRQIGGENMARFKLPAFDALYDKLVVIEDGPERNALFTQAAELAVAWMPYKYRVLRVVTDMAYPQLIGYRRPVFWNDWWQYVDIDESKRVAR